MCCSGKINKIQIDTHHFKGNFPDKCSLQGAYIPEKSSGKSIVNKSKKWKFLLNKVKLYANKKHNFQNKIMKNKKINYIRINIFLMVEFLELELLERLNSEKNYNPKTYK